MSQNNIPPDEPERWPPWPPEEHEPESQEETPEEWAVRESPGEPIETDIHIEAEATELQLEPVPWEQRPQLALFEAFIESIKMVLFHPSQFFARLPQKGTLESTLGFFLLLLVFLAVFSFPANFLDQVIQQMINKALGATGAAVETGMPLFDEIASGQMRWQTILTIQLVGAILTPILGLIFLFIYSAIYTVIGMLFSGRISYKLCFQVLAYAQCAGLSLIVNPIPILRGLVVALHWIVLLTIGFKYAAGLTTGKALLLALLPLFILIGLVFCCVCGGVFMTFVVASP